MRILIDENVPVQMLEMLRRLLPEHEVRHVSEIKWAGNGGSLRLTTALLAALGGRTNPAPGTPDAPRLPGEGRRGRAAVTGQGS
ncbi:hypothetical protein [Streptomyces radicis]|uniref:DUF5615 domain-containing protein n=1 Tax=Streptomyces radicis TaxID=1750517 RepID=A0A3A9W621_9ACTN|nr:hypothetical protein [Streptomyces radicis]RKN07883.1 hypothetical protein D7319_17625 [Streptomyces radicis]RKN20663.1 hypothetical protein D7318_17295 [Streptomyces radicis]